MECSSCGAPLDGAVPGWCAACRRSERVAAADLLDWLLVGGGTPVAIPDEPDDPDPLGWPGYDDLRERARTRSGADESVQVRRGRIATDGSRGPEAVVVAWEFGYLGGSMGSVAGARIAGAYDAARAAGLPVVLLPSTGGARMQEGMASLVQMAVTTAARADHAEAGLFQVAVLRHPTTGGVFASHANLADLVLAERGATIGFAGPRVSEAMTGGPLPTGSHTAAGAHAAGLVDAVVDRPDVPRLLHDVLRWAAALRDEHDARPAWTSEVLVDRSPDLPPPPRPEDPWAEVEQARADDRVRAPSFLAHGDVEVAAELRGDRAGDVDPALRVVCAFWQGRAVVVLAMDPAGGAIGPGGYRTGWRGLALAERLGAPVVTLVDTPGADAGAAAEAGGIAHHIAATFARLLDVRTPVVALVVGEGGSGGALALAVGDRLLLQEHAIFSVIAPEGAAAILHRDAGRAAEVAALLDPTAARLAALGVADEVVPEPPGEEVSTAIAAVARHLSSLAAVDGARLAGSRRARWRAPLR